MIRKLRILAAATLIAGAVIAVTAASVSANGGPHEGTFSVTTDACAGCHRAHTGQAEKLLRFNSQINLCYACHDGSASNVDVKDGIYLGTANGTQNAGLKGGGFETALINRTWDPSFNQTGTPEAINSRHSVGATNVVVWGSGNNTSMGLGETITDLECTNCHNPHGNGNYRMLRPRPEGVTHYDNTTANISISTNATSYTIAYLSGNISGTPALLRDRTAMYYGDSSANSTRYMVDDWCTQCHTRYKGLTSAAGHTDTGDPNYKFVHYTGLSGGCFVCHVAHGSSASMAGYAASTVMWPDGNATQTWQTAGNITETQTSRLLVANNRGACRQCHSSITNN